MAAGGDLHRHELRRRVGVRAPWELKIFYKQPNTLVEPNDGIRIRRGSPSTDWEVEIAIVIGKRARYIETLYEALNHVADHIDVVAVNAGIGAQRTIRNNKDAEWPRVFDVNVSGAAPIARATMPPLNRFRAEAIVLTSSIAGATGLTSRAPYSATKGSLNALTLALAVDSLPHGVRVNAVAPGTDDIAWVGRLLAAASHADAERQALAQRQPTGRLVATQEVADAVAHFASPRAGSAIGAVLPVDGGM